MHSCPDCGQACYCNGDFDDCECDPEAWIDCEHCIDDGFDDYVDEDENPMSELEFEQYLQENQPGL
jgi:hypothetical protein